MIATDIQSLLKKYHKLTEMWEEEGVARFAPLPQKLKDAEEKYEKDDSSKKLMDDFEKRAKRIDWIRTIADELEAMLNTKGTENDLPLWEARLKESQMLYVRYEANIKAAIEDIASLENQIERLKDGRALQGVKPRMRWDRESLLVILATIFALMVGCTLAVFCNRST